jgi:hypothetical protein
MYIDSYICMFMCFDKMCGEDEAWEAADPKA